MKKLTISIILAVLLCGCGEQKAPAPTPKQLPPQQKEAVIASFSTEILDTTPERVHNIDLAIKAVDGITINQGEVFSFNQAVGERTEQRGYKKANVMVNGEYVKDYGGGVCQVSTTIYNAVKIGGFKVVEHHTHKHPVAYVSAGDDAAVNYPDLDFKFKNDKNMSIVLKIIRHNGNVEVNIVHII